MAITRLAVETEIVSELGPLLSLAGKTATATGSNADLNGPLAFALQALSITPADPTAVTDADLSNLATTQFVQICEVAEYYAIKKCLNSVVMPNEMAQDRKQDWNDLMKRFQDQLFNLAVQYGYLLNIRRSPVQQGTPPLRWPTPTDTTYAIGGYPSVPGNPYSTPIGGPRIDH